MQVRENFFVHPYNAHHNVRLCGGFKVKIVTYNQDIMVLLEDISDLIQIRSTDLQSLVRDSTICYHPSIFYRHMDRFVL